MYTLLHRSSTVYARRAKRLGVNAFPSGLETQIKRLVLWAFGWHLISAALTQAIVDRFQLWSA
jgi:hypothetical protein